MKLKCPKCNEEKYLSISDLDEYGAWSCPECKSRMKLSLTFIWMSVLVIFGLIVLFGTLYTVGAGERAILITFGNPDMTPKSEGLHFKLPIVQSVVMMDVKTQKYEVLKASSASKDLQTVTTDVTLNYYIRPEATPEIYKTIGVNYQDKIIAPVVQEVVKASTAQYTAEELITKRPEVKEKIDNTLRERLQVSNIIVQSVAITNFDFSPEFNKAIEAKVTAEQNALAEKNKLASIEYQAQQRVVQAQGEADAIKIQAQAINAQGGEDYVKLQAINKWNGVMPSYVGGGAMPFIDIGSVTKSGSYNIPVFVNSTK